MLSPGVSYILVDDEKELDIAHELVGVDTLIPLSKLHENLDHLYEAVFYQVVKDYAEAEKFLQAYNVRRAIIIVGGKRRAHGRDVDWIKKSLKHAEKTHVVEAAIPAPVLTIGDILRAAHEQPEEKTDAHKDLGYK